MKKLYFVLFVLIVNLVLAQPSPLGIFDSQIDIGHPRLAGAGKYDAATHSYDVKGSGYNIWAARDEFHFVYKRIKGDFTATANFDFLGGGATANLHKKIGWMLRQSTDEKAEQVSAVEQGDGVTLLQWRSQPGESMKEPDNDVYFPDKTFEIIQLQRIGKKIFMRVGRIGEAMQTVGERDMPTLNDDALLGVFVCSHDPATVEEARIWDVHIDQTALAAK
jgi:TolB protein